MCCDKFDIYYCGPYFHTKCIFCLFSTNFYIHAVFFWQIGNIVKNQRALVSEVKLFEIITFFFFECVLLQIFQNSLYRNCHIRFG